MKKALWHYDLDPNIGIIDKSIRYLVGALLIAMILFVAPTTVGWYVLFPLIAIPIIASAYTGWDPLYALFQKRSTRLISLMKSKSCEKK